MTRPAVGLPEEQGVGPNGPVGPRSRRCRALSQSSASPPGRLGPGERTYGIDHTRRILGELRDLGLARPVGRSLWERTS